MEEIETSNRTLRESVPISESSPLLRITYHVECDAFLFRAKADSLIRRRGLNYSDQPVASTSATAAAPLPAPPVEPAGSLVELELVPDEPVDPEVILAERRRKRAEILAKYSKPAGVAVDSLDARADSPAVERENKRLKLDHVDDAGTLHCSSRPHSS